MRLIVRLVLGLALASGGVMHSARAQDAVVYVATYVEVMPSSAKDGIALLKEFGAAISKEDGNLRAELVQETSRPNRFSTSASTAVLRSAPSSCRARPAPFTS